MHLVYRVKHHAYLLDVDTINITVDINFNHMTWAGDIRFLQYKSIDLEENDSKYKINEWWCVLKCRKGRSTEKGSKWVLRVTVKMWKLSELRKLEQGMQHCALCKISRKRLECKFQRRRCDDVSHVCGQSGA